MGLKTYIKDILNGRKPAILGFGREGQSTYGLLRKYFPELSLAVFDRDEKIIDNKLIKEDAHVKLYCGAHYLEQLNAFDFVFKSPGISGKELESVKYNGVISSQSDVFLACFGSQTVGVTGTKGKSTTCSLLSHIFSLAGKPVLFVGNIGVPPFEVAEQINEDSTIVYELSSHQLETVSYSPHLAVWLNVFQEHLDHYENYEAYCKAKFNIALHQKNEDYVIFNSDNDEVNKFISHLSESQKLPYSLKNEFEIGCFIKSRYIECHLPDNIFSIPVSFERQIAGQHNLSNILSVISVCSLLGLEKNIVLEGLKTFKGLPHRLEYVGCFNGKHFYNDSIATIPEATIEALKTLNVPDTLILGGYDRGIDYTALIGYLSQSGVNNIVFTGRAGKRIYESFPESTPKKTYYFDAFDKALEKAIAVTGAEKICLLSPAAASYGYFRDFAERGDFFKKFVAK